MARGAARGGAWSWASERRAVPEDGEPAALRKVDRGRRVVSIGPKDSGMWWGGVGCGGVGWGGVWWGGVREGRGRRGGRVNF